MKRIYLGIGFKFLLEMPYVFYRCIVGLFITLCDNCYRVARHKEHLELEMSALYFCDICYKRFYGR